MLQPSQHYALTYVLKHLSKAEGSSLIMLICILAYLPVRKFNNNQALLSAMLDINKSIISKMSKSMKVNISKIMKKMILCSFFLTI
jgi:hypothetical protein